MSHRRFRPTTIIVWLLLIPLVVTLPSASAQNRFAPTAPPSPLQITYGAGAADVIEVKLSNMQRNPDGTVTAEIVLTSKKAVAYDLTFDHHGQVELKPLNLINAPFFPFIAKRTWPAQSGGKATITFAPGSSVTLKLNKFGNDSGDAIAMFSFDLAAMITLATLGDYTATVPDELIPGIRDSIIGLFQNSGFDFALFTKDLQNDDYWNAAKDLSAGIAHSPEVFVKWFHDTWGIVVSSKTLQRVSDWLGAVPAIPVLIDMFAAPGHVEVTIQTTEVRQGNADISLVIDRSGSMEGDSLRGAQNAAKQFVDFMANGDQVGIVSFSDAASTDLPLIPLTAAAPPIFADGAEAGTSKWVADPPWGLTTADAHSGTYSWTDSPDGNYADNSNVALTSTMPISLPTSPPITLSFWHKYALESNYDYGRIEISSDNGASWTQLAAYTGSQPSFSPANLDLSAYAGQQILVRFRLQSDGSVNDDGWYVDDIQIGLLDPRTRAKTVIDGISAYGGTSIGAGLSAASQQLQGSAAIHAHAIVLLTDGDENTPPYVADILPAILQQGIVVYTIGLGSSANVSLLQNIARQTGGTFSYAPSGADLRAIYDRIVGKIAGQSTLESLTGVITQGATNQQTATVDSAFTDATFSINWPGSDLNLSLVSPSGQVIDPSTVDGNPNIEYVTGATYEYYRIQGVEPGVWTLRTTGVSVSNPNGENYTTVVRGHTDLTIDSAIDQEIVQPGASLHITAFVHDNLGGLPGATVTANVPRQNGVFDQVVLYDDGAHDDGAAGDGVYVTTYNAPIDPGNYIITLHTSGQSHAGQAFAREATLTLLVSSANAPQADLWTFTSELHIDNGHLATYIIVFGNNGPDTAVNPAVIATLSANMTYISDDHGGWQDIPGLGKGWFVGDWPPGRVGTITMTVRLTNGAASGGQFVNTVQIASLFDPGRSLPSTADPNEANNLASVSTQRTLSTIFLPVIRR